MKLNRAINCCSLSSAEPIQSPGTLTKCSLHHSSVQHFWPNTKMCWPKVILLALNICSKKTSSMIRRTTPAISTYSAAVERTCSNFGSCGKRRYVLKFGDRIWISSQKNCFTTHHNNSYSTILICFFLFYYTGNGRTRSARRWKLWQRQIFHRDDTE